MLRERIANYFIFGSLFADPVSTVRVAEMIALNGPEAFGAELMKSAGGMVYGTIALTPGLIFWVAAPFMVSMRILKRQDI